MTSSLFATMLMTAVALPAVSADALDIDALRWRSRVLVVLAPRADDPRLVEQRRLFEAAGAAARDRDLVWLAETGDEARSRGLHRRFGVARTEFRSILVGKDGGAKLSAAEPIAPARLFAEIDAMPMRQDEMRGLSRSGSGR